MMRRQSLWVFSVLFVAAAAAGCAGKKAMPPAPSTKVGQPIVVAKAISLADLSTDPTPFVGQTVRLEGIVNAVCAGSGCWAEVKAADGSTFLAKSLDHSVLLPKDCVGRKIVVQGVVTAMPPAEDEVEAHEHHGHEGEEAVPHECPKPTYLVSTQGVELY